MLHGELSQFSAYTIQKGVINNNEYFNNLHSKRITSLIKGNFYKFSIVFVLNIKGSFCFHGTSSYLWIIISNEPLSFIKVYFDTSLISRYNFIPLKRVRISH